MKYKKIFSHILFIFISLIVLIGKVNATNGIYKSYKIGDEVTYNGMGFYVIENSDSNQDYVTLLKAKPIKKSEVNLSGTEIANKVEQSTNNYSDGYIHSAYFYSDDCTSMSVVDGTATGCTNDYKLSSIKQVVDTWANDNFKSSDLKEDSLGYSVRLITKEELINNLGYAIINGNTWYSSSPENTPSWVYNNKYWYWTMSIYEDYISKVWRVSNFDTLGGSSIDDSASVVRPVVNLKKRIENVKSLSDKTFNIGDIVYYNNIKFYVIKSSKNTDNQVTLVKAEPLTVDEVTKYGSGHINKYTSHIHNEPYDIDGYGGVAYYTNENCSNNDNNSGCNKLYDNSDIKYIVDSWGKAIFDFDMLTSDASGYSLRLLTFDEFVDNFGYVGKGTAEITASSMYTPSSDTPAFVSDLFNCWTMTSFLDDDVSVYYKNTSNYSFEYIAKMHPKLIDDIGRLEVYSTYATVCPVVTLKKSYDKQIVNVPDTSLSMPILGIIVGLLILAIAVIIICIQLRSKKKLEKF